MSDHQPPSMTHFADLISVALASGEPQRLLMVLLRTEPVQVRDEHGEYREAQEGTLTPLMVRDRPLEAGLSFEEIRAEADGTGQTDWSILMVAILGSQTGDLPGPEDAEPHLKRMAKAVLTGGDLSGFAFFDRNGDAVRISSSMTPG